MLGAFSLGSVELGGLISSALVPFVPVYTMRLEGGIALNLIQGDIAFSQVDGGMSYSSINGGADFI
jgi:hypothetical protein